MFCPALHKLISFKSSNQFLAGGGLPIRLGGFLPIKNEYMRILVTGGAGFIGSALIRCVLDTTDYQVLNLDKLTYSANLDSLIGAIDSDHYAFERIDVCDSTRVGDAIRQFRPTAILNLAAETHVDRSIEDPSAFMHTNVLGTYTLLDGALAYWTDLDEAARNAFRFVHVSTDEVFGSLDSDGHFDEESPYQPNSPYAASKASSDHLVRAWFKTYGLPTIVSTSSNNYGPFQFPEKLIPHIVLAALEGRNLPVYGMGENVRDWIHVEDHAAALIMLAQRGRPGETYGNY